MVKQVPLKASNAVNICDVLTNSGFKLSSWKGLASRLGNYIDQDSIATQKPNDSLRLQETVCQWLQNDTQASWEKLAGEVSRVEAYGPATEKEILRNAGIDPQQSPFPSQPLTVGGKSVLAAMDWRIGLGAAAIVVVVVAVGVAVVLGLGGTTTKLQGQSSPPDSSEKSEGGGTTTKVHIPASEPERNERGGTTTKVHIPASEPEGNGAATDCHEIETKADRESLEQELADIGNWEILCDNLGVDASVLAPLRVNGMPPENKKKECLMAFVKGEQPCWEKVVQVVAAYPFNNKRLAKKIANNHHVDYNKVVPKD